MGRTLLALLLLLPSFAHALELGYSLLATDGGSAFKDGRGLDLRVAFGDNGPRYSGDRWVATIGHINARENPTGWVGDQYPIDKSPGYEFFTFVHRWYTKGTNVRFFAGTGIGYRNVETNGYKGDYFIGSQWAFAQSLGFKWREHIEVAYDHLSTGRLVSPNIGEDYLRFSIIATFGE